MRILSELALSGEPVHRIGGKDLCELLGLSHAALTDLKKRGIAVHLGHDSWDMAATVTAYVAHLRSIAAGWGEGDAGASMTAERTRLAKEKADAQAMKNAVLRGELVEAEAVERQWSELLRQVRAGVLAVPSRLRGALNLSGADADLIDRELRAVLSELGSHAHD